MSVKVEEKQAAAKKQKERMKNNIRIQSGNNNEVEKFKDKIREGKKLKRKKIRKGNVTKTIVIYLKNGQEITKKQDSKQDE